MSFQTSINIYIVLLLCLLAEESTQPTAPIVPCVCFIEPPILISNLLDSFLWTNKPLAKKNKDLQSCTDYCK